MKLMWTIVTQIRATMGAHVGIWKMASTATVPMDTMMTDVCPMWMNVTVIHV